MEDIGLRIIYWMVIATGAFAITSGLIWLSFKLFTYTLKGLGYWKDTVYIMYLYFAMKRNDKTIKYRGATYRKEEESE